MLQSKIASRLRVGSALSATKPNSAATVPLITGPTPTNVVTFVGDSRSFTVTEIGTLPITNQWQFDNGGGYVSLTAKTNTTLGLAGSAPAQVENGKTVKPVIELKRNIQ